MKSLKEQNRVLKEYFDVTILIPKNYGSHPEADGIFLIPKWNKLGKTYNDAVVKVLEALKKDRSCCDWRDGNWDNKYFRPRLRDVPEIVSCQMGKKYKGNSVKEVRSLLEGKVDEFALGIYEVSIILLTNPDILKSYDDLWIDCAGDEYSYEADGKFSYAPLFYFYDGELVFAAHDVARAYDSYGAASGFSPQPKIDSRILESFEPSNLELRVKSLESDIEKIRKIINI